MSLSQSISNEIDVAEYEKRLLDSDKDDVENYVAEFLDDNEIMMENQTAVDNLNKLLNNDETPSDYPDVTIDDNVDLHSEKTECKEKIAQNKIESELLEKAKKAQADQERKITNLSNEIDRQKTRVVKRDRQIKLLTESEDALKAELNALKESQLNKEASTTLPQVEQGDIIKNLYNECIASMKIEHEKALKNKTEEFDQLLNKYNTLCDKYSELSKSYEDVRRQNVECTLDEKLKVFKSVMLRELKVDVTNNHVDTLTSLLHESNDCVRKVNNKLKRAMETINHYSKRFKSSNVFLDTS
ncbi:hypothetical protein CalGV032 [Clostera anastomosis granulovirus A]|uniref:Uncharacterized protein n=1 Tax=Clostera anastomosis granulovirus A TaxID=1986289 RepID=U5KB39_9BBAC|nr:hypothetical protein CalGV032 [Clostera anastomosis granulovirus Henan]AGQ20291.1 hypothetical protein CalGV032 [Clostera anastomosis granulovirus Henan]